MFPREEKGVEDRKIKKLLKNEDLKVIKIHSY